jgi:hypothetical protein
MRDYDWSFGFGFGTRYPIRRSGYDRGYGGGYGRPPMGGSADPGGGRSRQGRGGYGPARGYDRGIYGEDYPVFGGVPGGRREGMYYGGGGRQREGGAYGQDFERGGGRRRPGPEPVRGGFPPRGGMGSGPRGGAPYRQGAGQPRTPYDAGYARQPFLPDVAYQRHPELERTAPQRRDRWIPGRFAAVGPDDEEIQSGVRQNLYQDNFIDADQIEVEVNGGVVTLRGEVDDYLQARYAWDDAWETDGVRGVVNLLVVRTDQPAGGSPESQPGEDTEEEAG